eukprot:4726573-Pleurochrysis_carterae.AAC.1
MGRASKTAKQEGRRKGRGKGWTACERREKCSAIMVGVRESERKRTRRRSEVIGSEGERRALAWSEEGNDMR